MLSGPARIVAVDFGTKRVGLALADPRAHFAQPWGTFTQEESVVRLRRLDQQQGIAVVVVGWPLTEDGEEGMATQRVQDYINRLQKVLKESRLLKWDERYTSVEARDRLRTVGGPIPSGRIDTAAAGIILQDYLDTGVRNRDTEAS